MEELPSNFDVIIIGTGMPECIIAAAASRVGKTVLHLDRNGYYGGDWASFNYDQFMDWIEENKNSYHLTEVEDNLSSPEIELNGEELLIPCIQASKNILNICQKSYVRETHPPSSSAISQICQTPEITVSAAEPMELNTDTENSNDEPLDAPPSVNANANNSEESYTSATSSTDASNDGENSEHNVQGLDATAQSQSPDNQESNTNAVNTSPSTSSQSPDSNYLEAQQEWTVSGFRENRRKFNFDLAPKLLFARGSLVELLISSNIARYAEFQCVNRVLTFINGHIEQVPCSRADVFSTKNVTVVEKRMLMKLLTFCMNYQEHPEEYRGFEEKSFLEFLRSRKLTPNIEHYIMHAIAMIDESCSTLQGLEATQKFMQSLGRYGNSPFLWTCYGSAELPQCFCRLCAVFGGIYYLKRIADAIIVSDRIQGIVSMGQRINCQWVIMESSYAPPEFLPEQTPQLLSRAIFITDASLLPSERQQNTLLCLPPMSGLKNSVTVLEFGSKAYICPEDLYIVYMFSRSSSDSPEEDLKPATELLFKSEGNQSSGDNTDTKPSILWCIYYNQKDTTTVNLNSRVPEGLLITSSPDGELDYEQAVKEAKLIFEKICPGEDFLPRAPDPEDIVLENHANPGEEGGKIENDVKDSDNSTSEELKDEPKNQVSEDQGSNSSEISQENEGEKENQ